jgi:hypothetical protein
MHATGQIGTRKERDVGELTDAGVGPLAAAPGHRLHHLLLSIFQLLRPHLHFTSTSSASYFLFSPYNTS